MIARDPILESNGMKESTKKSEQKGVQIIELAGKDLSVLILEDV